MTYFKRPIFFGIAIVFLSFTFNSWAEMTPGSFNFSPSIGGYVFERNQSLDNGPTFGLVGGYSFDNILGGGWGARSSGSVSRHPSGRKGK